MLLGFTGRRHCQSMTVSNVAWFHREQSLSIHDCFKCCLVLQGQVTVDPVDKKSRTPLHYAVQSCENTIIDLLLGRSGYQAYYTLWHCHSGSLLGRISFCTCYHFCLGKPILKKRFVSVVICLCGQTYQTGTAMWGDTFYSATITLVLQ